MCILMVDNYFGKIGQKWFFYVLKFNILLPLSTNQYIHINIVLVETCIHQYHTKLQWFLIPLLASMEVL